MAIFTDTLRDQYGEPIKGALVYIYAPAPDWENLALASLTLDGIVPALNPLTTDQYGLVSFHADVGVYKMAVWVGGKQVFAETIEVGTPLPLDEAVAVALSSPNGAALIGTDTGETQAALNHRNLTYASRAALAAANVPVIVAELRLQGYAAAGDGGEARYKRVGSNPGHAGAVQSADGAWWEINENEINARQFGFLPTETGANNNTALQAAIDYARAQTEVVLTNKYVIVLADVYIPRGEYNLAGAVEIYTGIRLIGSGQSTTLIRHEGGASHCFVFTATAPEVMYNAWVQDLAIVGAGKTTSDTLSAVKADTSNTAGLAIYGCGVTRCLVSNCYEAVNVQNSWTFEISDCEFYDVGRNFIRALNITAAKIKGNRMDGAGEDGVFITFSAATAYETVACLLSQNVIQGCQRRAIYGYDADHVIWDSNYVENCNQAGGYPHVEFASNSGTNAEFYSFSGGWVSPSSQSGQPAFKIDRARFVSSHGVYIRGNNFSYGWELGANVEGYSIHGEFNGGTLLNVSGDTVGLAAYRQNLQAHRINSETLTTSATSSNVNSSLTTRVREINCTSGNRTFTLLNAHLQYGRRFTVQKVDGGTNLLVVAPEGTTEINGVNASVNSAAAYARAEIYCGYKAATTTLCWYVKFS